MEDKEFINNIIKLTEKYNIDLNYDGSEYGLDMLLLVNEYLSKHDIKLNGKNAKVS